MNSPDSSDAKQRLSYGILGDDTRSTEEKLSKYSGSAPWSFLAPHYEMGSLYFVDPKLELNSVGAAITGDDAKKVELWLKSGDLVKIDALHAHYWQGSDVEFEVLVVSPFVLCRPQS